MTAASFLDTERPATAPADASHVGYLKRLDRSLQRMEARFERIEHALGLRKPKITQAAAARMLGVSQQTLKRRYIDTGVIRLDGKKIRRKDVEGIQ